MGFGLGSISSALGSIGGSIAGSMIQHQQQKSLNRQMFNYNKEMATHQYQWGVEDAEAAGLNPAIVGNLGGSGSTSAGGGTQNPIGSMEGMLNTLTNASAVQKDNEVKEAQRELLHAQTAGVLKNNGWIDNKANQDIKESESRIIGQRSTSALQGAQKEKTHNETKKIREGKVSEYIGTDAGSAASNLLDMLNPVGGIARAATNALRKR